jgi:hypothetical protein
LTVRSVPFCLTIAVDETARIALTCRWTPAEVSTTEVLASEADTSGLNRRTSDAPTADVSANENTSNQSIARLIAHP